MNIINTAPARIKSHHQLKHGTVGILEMNKMHDIYGIENTAYTEADVPQNSNEEIKAMSVVKEVVPQNNNEEVITKFGHTEKTVVVSTNSTEKRRFYYIDTYMLPAKFAYFFQLAKDFSYQPFMVLFLTATGLSKGQAGLITGLRLIGLILGAPLWGTITDRFQNPRKIITLVCCSSIVLMCSQPFISALISPGRCNICPYDRMHCKEEAKKEREFKSTIFFVMLFINIAASFFDGCTMGIIDAGVVRRIALSDEQDKDFGWNRAFGGFGFAFGSLISGLFISNFPITTVNCYSAIFVVYFICTVGLLISSWFLFATDKNIEKENAHTEVTKGDGLTKLLLQTLTRLDVVLFLLTMFMAGTQQSVFVSFTTVALRDLKASVNIQGLAISIAGLSCVLSIALSTKFIKLFRGTWNTIIICALTYVARFLLFANITNPVLAVPISLFQSFGLGLFIAAAVHHVKSIAPTALNTTMYGIMNSMHFGIGFIFGNITGGQIFHHYGSKVLFTSSAVLIGAWCVVLIGYRTIVWLMKTKQHDPEA